MTPDEHDRFIQDDCEYADRQPAFGEKASDVVAVVLAVIIIAMFIGIIFG